MARFQPAAADGDSGKIAPVVDRAYPLSETPAAIRYLQEGRACGKVVITI